MPTPENDNTTDTIKENANAATATNEDVIKSIKETARESARRELKELLQNGLYIYKKMEHFTADEIDELAKWIHDRMEARAAGL